MVLIKDKTSLNEIGTYEYFINIIILSSALLLYNKIHRPETAIMPIII